MKPNLTILTITVAVLLATRTEAQQSSPGDDYLLVAAGTAPAEATYSSYIGDVDLVSMGGGAKQKGDAGGGKGGCGRSSWFGRTFATGEFMHWYSKGRSLPPLVTTGPPVPVNDAGVLGRPGTVTLFGGDQVGDQRQAGGRLSVGMWMDENGQRAVGFRGFGVEGRSIFYSAASSGNPVLARPYFNDDPLPLFNGPDALLVVHPALSQFGTINIKNDHEVYGGQAFFRSLMDWGCNYRLDLIGGYRYDRIDDDLLISSFTRTAANTFTYVDLFDVKNEYNAGDLGIQLELYRNCLTMSFLGKVALGNMRQEVLINGQHTITGGGFVQGAGGLLTQPTNINVYERDLLVWAPEANVKISYAATDRLSLTVGYSFLYWTRVALAGDQIDQIFTDPRTPRVNGTQLNGGTLVGPATPTFRWRDTDFWVQTVDLGVSFNY